MAIGFLLQVMGGSITIYAVGRRFAEAFAAGQQMSLAEAFTIILVPSHVASLQIMSSMP